MGRAVRRCRRWGRTATGRRRRRHGQRRQDGACEIGWEQDPRTLNPFVGLDEEDWNIWSINYDLLVNFSPDDLSPAPGIAKTWDVSEDKKTVTFHLDPDKNWSDGKPVTSADVKWSLDVLGKNGAGFTGYTSNISSIETPDPETVVIKTKRPTPASSAACTSTSSPSTSGARSRSAS